MRPRELPPVPQDGSWDEAEVGVPIEGRHEPPRQVEGGRVQHQGGKKPTKRSRSPPRARQEGVRETYRTPPSSWTEIREQPALGSQTGQAGSSELERELEKEMFERIQEENLQLKEEIERLRQRESASSWSQLSEKTSPVPPPPRREWESENRARFTPGGTQVPSTPPPTEEVEMPVFPWWVGSRDQEGVPHAVARGPGGVRGASECGGDKVCLGPKVEERGKECDGLRGWQEMERKNVEVMTPLEARAAWLEREAKRLQEAMHAANQGDGRRLKSTYWSTPFERVSEREQEEAHDEERDSLKAIPIVLPKLPEPDVRNAPLEAGDWIAQLTPLIGDVSTQAASWWSFVMSQVTKRYHSWLEAGPLDKLNIGCPDPVQMARGSCSTGSKDYHPVDGCSPREPSPRVGRHTPTTRTRHHVLSFPQVSTRRAEGEDADPGRADQHKTGKQAVRSGRASEVVATSVAQSNRVECSFARSGATSSCSRRSDAGLAQERCTSFFQDFSLPPSTPSRCETGH